MPFNKLTAFTQKVADAADTIAGNPALAKSIFDAAPEELRQKFNDLIDALKSTATGDSGAKNTGATAISGLTGTDIQSLLESLNANKVSKTFPGWTALPLWTASAWSAYGNGKASPAYTVSEDGWISLKGAAHGGVQGTWIAMLPEGKRPSEELNFVCAHNSGNVTVRLTTDGAITLSSPSYDLFISLESIRFRP